MQPVRLIFDRHENKQKDVLGKSAFDDTALRKVAEPETETQTENETGNQSDYDPMAMFRNRNNPVPVPPPGAKKWDSRDMAPKRHHEDDYYRKEPKNIETNCDFNKKNMLSGFMKLIFIQIYILLF